MSKYLIKSETCILQNIFNFYDIKRDLLLYDKVGVFSPERVLQQIQDYKYLYSKFQQEQLENAFNEINYLIEKEYFIDHKQIIGVKETKVEISEKDKELAEVTMGLRVKLDKMDKTLISDRIKAHMEWDELNTRLWCSIANNVDETKHCIAGLNNYYSYDLPSENKSKAYDIVHKMLHLPSDDTPWEKIFDFKNDNEAKLKMYALRDWINDLPNEIKYHELTDKINHLQYEYSESLRRHKIETRLTKVKTLVTAIPKALSELIRLKFDKSVEALFDVSEQFVNFQKFEERNNLKGNELAYITHVNNKFEQNKKK